MPRTVSVTCDACGRDLTTTGNEVDYRILVKSDPIPHSAGVVTAMMIWPPLDADHYFCGLRCLDVWRARSLAARTEPVL